mmetsp:Transcript_11159/g.32966  ORF Transcript_11159/g.32966 Transcript_11159/m.32966 type:complete len:248 (+) Transcript_11159:112-855(+)
MHYPPRKARRSPLAGPALLNLLRRRPHGRPSARPGGTVTSGGRTAPRGSAPSRRAGRPCCAPPARRGLAERAEVRRSRRSADEAVGPACRSAPPASPAGTPPRGRSPRTSRWRPAPRGPCTSYPGRAACRSPRRPPGSCPAASRPSPSPRRPPGREGRTSTERGGSSWATARPGRWPDGSQDGGLLWRGHPAPSWTWPWTSARHRFQDRGRPPAAGPAGSAARSATSRRPSGPSTPWTGAAAEPAVS